MLNKHLAVVLLTLRHRRSMEEEFLCNHKSAIGCHFRLDNTNSLKMKSCA